MALKHQVATLEDVPEPLREHYIERDGKYEIQVEGMKTVEDVSRVMESLRKERLDHDQAKARVRGFGEHTPESIETLTASLEDTQLRLDAASKEGGPSDDDIDKLVENRAQQRVRPLERKITQLGTELESITGVNKKLAAEKRSGAILKDVLDAATAKDVGITADALPDVELWAERVFEQDDSGRILSKDGMGVTPGLSSKEVFADMKSSGQRRHWFGATVGAGATGGTGSGNDSASPYTKEGYNLTKAAQLSRSDPARAKRLAKAANREDMLPKALRDSL